LKNLKSIKKLLCSVICLVLLINTFAMLAMAEEVTEESTYGKSATGLLSALEIIDYSEENLDEKITRGEFFKMVCLATGYEGTKSEELLFYDLPLDHQYEPYIKTLAKIGIIGGTADGKVLPDGEITFGEASAVLVKSLGYSVAAEAKGGFPTGYLAVANQLDLFDSVENSLSGTLTKGDAAVVMENALNADLMYEGILNNEGEYKVQKGETLLNTVHHVEHINAVVEGVDISRIVGENDINPFFILVGETEIYAYDEGPLMYDYLGYDVDVYFTEGRHRYELVYIEKTDTNNVEVIDVEDVKSISSGSLKALSEDGKKVKNYSLINGIPVLYNGVSTDKPFTMDLIANGKKGEIRLLDNDGNKRYDVAIVEVYDNYFVTQVDTDKGVVYGRFGKKATSIDTTTDEPYVLVFDENGKEVKASAIKPNDVIAVYDSFAERQQYIVVQITRNAVEGVFEESSENHKYITVGGIEYETNIDSNIRTTDTKYRENFDLGTNIIIYLDKEGKVAAVKKGAAQALNYGFVIGVGEDSNGFNDKLEMKLFGTDDAFYIYPIAKTVKVDGEIYKDSDRTDGLNRIHLASLKEYGEDTPADCYATTIRYSLNANGEINVIDTILKEGTEELTMREDFTDNADSLFMIKTSQGSHMHFRATNLTIGSQISYTNATVSMLHPDPITGDLDDEDKYLATTVAATFTHDHTYDVSAFYSNKKSIAADVFSYTYSDNVYSNIDLLSQFYIVDKVGEALDKEEEDVYSVRCIGTSGESRILIPKDFKMSNGEYASTLKRGDIIRYRTDIKGNVTTLQVHFKVMEGEGKPQWALLPAPGVSTTAQRAETSMRKAFVYDKLEGGWLLYFTEEGREKFLEDVTAVPPEVDSTKCELMSLAAANAGVMVIRTDDPNKWEIEPASFSDLKAYTDTYGDCSEILIHQWYGTPVTILIVE